MENVKRKIIKIANRENILVLSALLMLTILISALSCSSIVNTTDYLQIDVSVWTCIAKKMQSGQVIYKDIFDHKGPILYLFYYLGYLFAGTKGIGLLDFIINFADAVLVYEIARKLKLEKTVSIVVVTIFMAFYSYLCLENPCSESMAMPFILLSLYYFIEFIINQNKFYRKESIITRNLSWYCFNDKTKFSICMANI